MSLSKISIAPTVTTQPDHQVLGWWHRDAGGDTFSGPEAFRRALGKLRQQLCVVHEGGEHVIARGGVIRIGIDALGSGSLPVAGYASPLALRNLGDPSFTADYRLEYPYMAGAMANGIASRTLVEAMARAGLLSAFGAAGKSVAEVEAAVDHLSGRLSGMPYCFNLIHSPNEPLLEAQIVDLYLRRGVRVVEASAYLSLTLPVVRYRVHGIYLDPRGRIVTPNRIIAKASRVEVASKWFSPPPDAMLVELVKAGHISNEQAELASRIPMAQDLTAEADSGGHTDNRPAITLLPTMLSLRDRLQDKHSYATPLRVGCAGGIATPIGAAAAFAMGAAYIVTGTVNQACVESGSSDQVRQLLAQAEQADVSMAPAADMFEMGVKLQVLKRGTLFPMRAAKLYDVYLRYNSPEEIPNTEREALEKSLFRRPLTEVWEQTQAFFQDRDPGQLDRARLDGKHRLALLCRWYLGSASRWANEGDSSRQVDFQIWCGPAMGAFNEWARGSFLEYVENREVVTVAMNLLYGAGVVTRVSTLLRQGLQLDASLKQVVPLPLADIEERLA